MDIIINISWIMILFFILAIIALFVFARAFKDKLDNVKDMHFKDKDVEVTTESFKRIGEVKNGSKNELILSLQNVENNKEIHHNNIVIEELTSEVAALKKANAEQLANFAVLQKRFNNMAKSR